jgi:molybdate transport system substrate-binding protein
MQRRLFALLLALCLVLAAIPARAGDLIVSAAASLAEVLKDMQPAFEKAHPGTRLVFNMASSGDLYRQIESGAPADVFASADLKWMDKAVAAKLVDESTRAVFATNALVLAVPAPNPAKITTVADLAGKAVGRIGIGAPEHVPAGAYAKKALEALGLWDVLKPKLIPAESVRQVLDYLARGEVDCGFVYATDAKKGGAAVTTLAVVPEAGVVAYPVAVVATSGQKALAAEFVQFLAGPEAAPAFAARGFSKP